MLELALRVPHLFLIFVSRLWEAGHDRYKSQADPEMIALGEKILRADGSENEIHAAVALFDANCPNPRKNGLIFWPHGDLDDPHQPNQQPRRS